MIKVLLSCDEKELVARLTAHPELRIHLLSLVRRIPKVCVGEANALLAKLRDIPSSMAAAQHIFELLQRTEAPNIRTLTHYANVARNNHKPEIALAMRDLAHKLGLQVDLLFYSALIRACGVSKETKKQEALELLAEMKQQGLEPDMSIYLALIRTCARHGDVSAALKVMAMVEADGLPYTLPLLTTLANVCSTQPFFAKKGFAVLNLMQQHGIAPDLAAFNALLKCCAIVDDIAGMQQIFQLMKEQDLSSDEFTMLSLIVGQLANDNLQAARDIVSSFRILGVTPSVKTYHKLFSVCKRTHDLDAALNLWDQMREEQVEPDLPIFNALMDIYAHRGDLEQVHQLLDAMKAQGLEPTPTEVACLLAVMYHRDGRVTEAGYQLVEDMRREGKVAPHLATFSPFIDILLKADKIDEAWDVRRNMMARWDIQPDKVLNRTFLFALAAKRDVDKIDELFRHMEAHPREFFPHCDSIVLLLEHWLARDPRSPRVAEVLETLQRLNVAHKLSRQVFVEPALQVIDGLIDQNSFDRARKLLRYLDPNKLETYTRLFATCRRPEHWPMLEEFWDMLMEPRRRIQPDGTVALAYLEALCRLGRTHDAVHFLHNMVHKQSFPDLEHYNLVLRHASSNDKWNFVRKVLKLMRYDRVTGDNVTAAIRERLHEVDGSLEEESAE